MSTAARHGPLSAQAAAGNNLPGDGRAAGCFAVALRGPERATSCQVSSRQCLMTRALRLMPDVIPSDTIGSGRNGSRLVIGCLAGYYYGGRWT